LLCSVIFALHLLLNLMHLSFVLLNIQSYVIIYYWCFNGVDGTSLAGE
jgi:hypothetical protein